MIITDVRPSGGYQGEKEHLGATQHLLPTREFFRAMYPGELVYLLNKFKHPRWDSVGVLCNRWGARPREEAGISDHGTIYVANGHHREILFATPCNCLPYSTIKTKTWDEDTSRWSSEGEFVRGWRTILSMMLKQGHFRPDEELSYLIGLDSFREMPREFWR